MQLINTVLATEIREYCGNPPVPCGPGGKGAVPIVGFEGLFANVIGQVLGFAAIILFIMLIVGGFKYITAGGNPQSAESAKKTITYAIFGVVLVASAYLILRLIGAFTGADVENFEVYKD